MKLPAACLLLLSVALAVNAQTPSNKDKATESKEMPAKPGSTTTKQADNKKKEEPKKEAPLPKIPGTVITRENGNLLGLEVVGGRFKLTFYDKKHKPMAMDVTRALARWPNLKSATPGQFRTMLNGSGTSLVGDKPVLPPYVFNVYLTLLQGEGDDAKAVETYVVPFRG
jgi:hypothetical protein